MGNSFKCEGFDLAFVIYEGCLDVYRGEVYDFKNKQNELPNSSGILCGVA